MPRWAQLAAVAAILALGIAVNFVSPGADASNATNYSYDAWGRVTGATYSGSANVTTGYVYDPAGNRTQAATAAAPVANPIALGVAANTSANPAPLSVSGPYTSVAVHSAASHGTATASGTSITYSPTTGYTGADSFTYTATNGSGTSPGATALV
ncbi:MAG: Ig-like domain-containing protein, partial [Caulobacteraceae bacterium]